MADTEMVEKRAPTTLSKRMRRAANAAMDEGATGDSHPLVIEQWADEVEALEEQLEAYRALDSRDFIDAEEAFARLEDELKLCKAEVRGELEWSEEYLRQQAERESRPLIAPKIHGRRSVRDG